MEEDTLLPPPPKRRRRTQRGDGDGDDNEDDQDDQDGIELNSLLVVLPEETILDILSNYLDVRDLVEIKLVSRQWKILCTTAIDAKGIGTTRKAFETNQELKNAVRRYCPLPDGDIDDETTTLHYCDREIAEDIACTYGWPINKWDVSQIEDFDDVFDYQAFFDVGTNVGVQLFNEDISAWDVSSATSMSRIFSNTRRFNQELSTWNVSNVRDMSYIFGRAIRFNQNISTWDVSNVIDMEGMFVNAIQFNQNLSAWDVSNVRNMARMFERASQFNQDLSTWNISNVTNMLYMFDEAQQLHQNQDIFSWGGGWARWFQSD